MIYKIDKLVRQHFKEESLSFPKLSSASEQIKEEEDENTSSIGMID